LPQHNIEELKLLIQGMLGLFLAADFGFYLYLSHTHFPWFALLGAGIGLSIIVLCWSGRKYVLFIASLLVFTVVHTIYYNWNAIFNIH